jgi:hypothetical protein
MVRDKRKIWLGALLLTGAVLLATNRWFTFFEDEIAFIDQAVEPPAEMLRWYSGEGHGGKMQHPPLHELLLGMWMRLTDARVPWIRVPAVIYFVAGLWCLVLAAERVAGEKAATATLAIGALWPYGFHFGRVAGWYSLVFFCVALVTWAYLRLLDKRTRGAWAIYFVACLLLVYVNYLGWAVVGLLALDYWWRERHGSRAGIVAMGGALAGLVILYAPLLPVFMTMLFKGYETKLLRPAHPLVSTVLLGGFGLYTTAVSESVAPWIWWLSVPVTAAIGVCFWIVWRYADATAGRLLAGFLVLLGALVFMNVMTTKRLLLPAAWLLLPLGIAWAQTSGTQRKALAAALGVIGAAGWYGTFTRQYYSSPRLIEPWNRVAEQTAAAMREGAIVIGNNPAFFFSLAGEIQKAQGWPVPKYRRNLPTGMTHPQVFGPDQWLRTHQTARQVLLVKGVSDPEWWKPTEEVERWLDANCRLEQNEKLLPDSGIGLKEKFYPGMGQKSFRIEIRKYGCAEKTAN